MLGKKEVHGHFQVFAYVEKRLNLMRSNAYFLKGSYKFGLS